MASASKKTSHRVVKVLYFGFILIVLLTTLYFFRILFAPLVASVLLALVFGPLVNRVETAGFRRLHIIIGIYLCIVIIAIGALVFVIPGLVKEAQTFAENLPQYKITVKNGIAELQHTLETKFPALGVPDIAGMIGEVIPAKKVLDVGALFRHLSGFFAVLSMVVIVPVITFFLLADGHLILKAFLIIIPNSYFEMSALCVHRIILSLKYFIRGQLIDAGFVGIMTWLFLTMIGLPYALVIGIIAALGNLIPYLGPVIGFMPAFFVVLTLPGGFSFVWLIKIVAVFVFVQSFETVFVYPLVVGKSVNLHPLVVILGVLAGGQIAGVPGMLLAVPIISIVKVLLETLYSYLKSYSII